MIASPRWFLKKSHLVFLILFCIGFVFTSSVHASNDDDEVKNAFADGTDFPWYDSDQDQVQTVDVSAGSRAATIDRDKIPEAAPTTGPNFPGGVSEGVSSVFSTAVFIAVICIGCCWDCWVAGVGVYEIRQQQNGSG